MISKHRWFLLFLSLVFLPQALLVANQEKIEKLRQRLEGIDSSYDVAEIRILSQASPDSLEAVLVLDDPNNHRGRWNGLGYWCFLAASSSISMERFFDAAVQVLSRLQGYPQSKQIVEERREFVSVISSFGRRPLLETPIYTGVNSSIGFLLLCINSLAKHKLIPTDEFLVKLLHDVEDIKSILKEGEEKNRGAALRRLQELRVLIQTRPANLNPDSLELLSEFSNNILHQLASPPSRP